jgi:hypothetical protein
LSANKKKEEEDEDGGHEDGGACEDQDDVEKNVDVESGNVFLMEENEVDK